MPAHLEAIVWHWASAFIALILIIEFWFWRFIISSCWLLSKFQASSRCLWLPGVGITGIGHHTWLFPGTLGTYSGSCACTAHSPQTRAALLIPQHRVRFLNVLSRQALNSWVHNASLVPDSQVAEPTGIMISPDWESILKSFYVIIKIFSINGEHEAI